MDLEEVENFKDVEITFSDHKAIYFDTNYSIDEEQDDRDSEENLPRRSG